MMPAIASFRARACAAGLVGAGVTGAAIAPPPADPIFHLMQIEQVIGGVAGDATAQAIQLRMRDDGQNEVQFSRLRAWGPEQDGFPLLLIDFDSPVRNGSTADRVLIASPGFCRYLDPPLDPDFMLGQLIPEAWLAAGSVAFLDGNQAYWRLSWGGEAYLGPTGGLPINDPDGEFGPPHPAALPADGLQALRFPGPAEAFSSSNLEDYTPSAGPSVWTNNAGESATLVARSCSGDANDDGEVSVDDLAAVILAWGSSGCAGDVNGDGAIDVDDLVAVILAWGPCPG